MLNVFKNRKNRSNSESQAYNEVSIQQEGISDFGTLIKTTLETTNDNFRELRKENRIDLQNIRQDNKENINILVKDFKDYSLKTEQNLEKEFDKVGKKLDIFDSNMQDIQKSMDKKIDLIKEEMNQVQKNFSDNLKQELKELRKEYDQFKKQQDERWNDQSKINNENLINIEIIKKDIERQTNNEKSNK